MLLYVFGDKRDKGKTTSTYYSNLASLLWYGHQNPETQVPEADTSTIRPIIPNRPGRISLIGGIGLLRPRPGGGYCPRL